MTIPTERYRAIRKMKEAAYEVFKRGKDRPSLTRLREIFRSALRHYPNDCDTARISECKRCRKILERDKSENS